MVHDIGPIEMELLSRGHFGVANDVPLRGLDLACGAGCSERQEAREKRRVGVG